MILRAIWLGGVVKPNGGISPRAISTDQIPVVSGWQDGPVAQPMFGSDKLSES